MRTVLNYNRTGYTDSQIIKDHKYKYAYFMGEATARFLAKSGAEIVPAAVFLGFMDRFVNRSSSTGLDRYDLKSHAYSCWEQGYYIMCDLIDNYPNSREEEQ